MIVDQGESLGRAVTSRSGRHYGNAERIEDANLQGHYSSVARPSANLARTVKVLAGEVNNLNFRNAFDTALQTQIYRPRAYGREEFAKLRTVLGSAGVRNLELETLNTDEGHSIQVFYAPQISPTTLQPTGGQSKTKIFFHGNADDIGYLAGRAIDAYKEGYNICLTSYRGYSGNPGEPSQEGLIADGTRALNFLFNEKSIKPEDLDLEAHSLGCAVAIHCLAELQVEINKLVLFAPFASVRRSTARFLRKFTGPLAPWFAKRLCNDYWNNLEALPKVKAKRVEIIHGEKDTVTPIDDSLDLVVARRRAEKQCKLKHSESSRHHTVLNIPVLK